MASMLTCPSPKITILDAGAGIGSLLAAAVDRICVQKQALQSIHVTAYEIDPILLTYLHKTVKLCEQRCLQAGIVFTSEVRAVDFIEEASGLLSGNMFLSPLPYFTAAILNPPYRKINSKSRTRHFLREIGIETSNLYTGFLAVATKLLAPQGELIAITPRSFCNGTYFRTFRAEFLRDMALQRIHLFDSREDTFRDDSVLQETIIVHALKQQESPEYVCVTTSIGAEDDTGISRELPYKEVVHPDDPERFIRIVSDASGQQTVSRMTRFQSTLGDLGLTVSTGRVVEFRVTEFLRATPEQDDMPLLYPTNLENNAIVWPKSGRKPQALIRCKEIKNLLVPNEHYTLVKRFTSKEQVRRVVAAVFEGGQLPGAQVGFENHLNYFHNNGKGLDLSVARGLSIFLNSTLVDAFFRQFNGHTQVNAGDLRSLKYPTLAQLRSIGKTVGAECPAQLEIDNILEQELLSIWQNPRPTA